MCRFQPDLCADFSTSQLQTLARLMYRLQHVLCADFSMSYVQSHAGARVARLARVARFASVQRPYVYINTDAIANQICPSYSPSPCRVGHDYALCFGTKQKLPYIYIYMYIYNVTRLAAVETDIQLAAAAGAGSGAVAVGLAG